MSWVTTDVEITVEDINAAKTGEGWAQELVIGALQDRISTLAASSAQRHGGNLYDDLFQSGMTAVWGALGEYEVTTVDDFRAYMYRVAQIAITHALSDERHQGADRRAVQIFAHWVRVTDGDLDLAYELAQKLPDGGGRLGRERAWAARQSWTVTPSLDAEITTGDADGFEAGNTLADLLVSDLGIPEEFLTSDDESRRQREARIELVRSVLASMGDAMANVLKMTYGVEPFGEYGRDNEAIAAQLGKTAANVRSLRTLGHKAFATKYIKLITSEISDPELMDQVREDWWEAFYAQVDSSKAHNKAE